MILKVLGPFVVHSQDKENIFYHPLAKEKGIYVFAVPYKKDKYLASYVGETEATFLKRIKEHTINTLGGYNRIFNPEAMKKGKKELIWGGLWKATRQDCFSEFVERYIELAPTIYEFIKMFSVFLLPLKAEKRIRRRVESAIAHHLYQQPDPVGSFLDSDIRYINKLNKKETPFQVIISGDSQILGFPKQISA